MNITTFSERTIKTLLFASVALNLFLAGIVTTHWWRPFFHERPRGVEEVVERVTRSLGEKDASMVRATFQASQPKLATLLADLQQARRDVRAKLTAEPFDPAAFHAAINTAHSKREAYDQAMRDVIVQAVDQLSPDGRQHLWSRERR